jgi:DNA-binding NtrC family response regulator
MPHTILLVDDDPVQRRLLEAMIRRFGYEPMLASSGAEALERLGGPLGAAIDIIILDLVMPDLDGMGVLARMSDRGIDKPVIVQTAHGSIDTVISAMRAGAIDFVVKPVGAERLQISLKNALRMDALEGEVRRINRQANNNLTFKDLITKSPEMARVIRLGERTAKSTIPVLIEGESGVGKELVARAIQGVSDRRGKALVTVNCGAIPENLVESLLFGHEKGSFTGAMKKHAGKFVEANGGTLFLDEIGELPLAAQAKLLRAIQYGEVDPVGGRKTVKVDVRIISATNRNLIELVRQGRFREDLFYRLNVFPIGIPPLRQRREDVPDLARAFLAHFGASERKRIRGFSAEAMSLITSFDWPGNVRQLENAIFRAVVLCDSDEITIAELPQIAAQVSGFPVKVPPIRIEQTSAFVERPPDTVTIEVRDPNVLKLLDDHGDVRDIETLEADIIRFAKSHYRGHLTEVARRLKIGRSTLYRKLKQYGLDDGSGTQEDVSHAA